MTAIPGVPRAINNRGQVVGANEDRAFLGRGRDDLGTSPGDGLTSVALAINERGLVVGISGQRAFAWQSGTLTDLGPGGAVAVNERGQIAGSRNGHAALWTPVG